MDNIKKLRVTIENNRLIKAVCKAGKAMNFRVFLVGGFIRDFFLGSESADLDFIIQGNSKALAEKVSGGLGMKPIILEKGPVTNVRLVKRGLSIDLTNLVGNSIDEDLARRDFTINSLAYSIQSRELIDLHNGLEDLRFKIIRSVSDRAFREDPLRTLRAFRFVCTLDDFSITDSTWSQIKEYASLISTVSVERIKGELDLILLSPKAPSVYKAMAEAGLLQPVFKEFFPIQGNDQGSPDLEVLRQVKNYLPRFPQIISGSRGFRKTDPLMEQENRSLLQITGPEEKCLYYASIFRSLGNLSLQEQLELDEDVTITEGNRMHLLDKANGFMKRTRFSNFEIKKINTILLGKDILRKYWTGKSMDKSSFRLIINEMGWDTKLCALLFLAERPSCNSGAAFAKAREFVTQLLELMATEGKNIIDPPVLLTGNEVSRITGLQPGLEIGRILKNLKYLQIKGVITSRQAALQYLLDNAHGLKSLHQ